MPVLFFDNDEFGETEMADIDAKSVMALRKRTGAPMMDCKKALQEVETLRASNVTKATVEAEAKIKVAEGEAQAIQMMADAKL